MKYLLSGFWLSVPLISSAQTIQNLLINIPIFLSKVIIPFLFGIAFLIFVINVVRFFILGAGNEQDREKAKYLAIYSIIAFVFLVIFWGIVNLLLEFSGLEDTPTPCTDYEEQFGGC